MAARTVGCRGADPRCLPVPDMRPSSDESLGCDAMKDLIISETRCFRLSQALRSAKRDVSNA